MSLIVCDECGKEISDKSSSCIYCGNPIYSKEHVNVVLLERSWIDLSDEEKNSFVCEYEKKTGVSFRYTNFFDCCSGEGGLVLVGIISFLLSILALVGSTDDFSSLLRSILGMLISSGMIFWFSISCYNKWIEKRGQINWNIVNCSKEFTKWLKSSKNIVK